jgi:hypothetical protein
VEFQAKAPRPQDHALFNNPDVARSMNAGAAAGTRANSTECREESIQAQPTNDLQLVALSVLGPREDDGSEVGKRARQASSKASNLTDLSDMKTDRCIGSSSSN